MLFWMVYLMDKMISLRLGHASAIQDFEIALPKPQPSEIFSESTIYLMNFWIDLARVQGQISEQLYSPAALMESSNLRTERAEKLAHDLREAYEARAEVRSMHLRSDALLSCIGRRDHSCSIRSGWRDRISDGERAT